MQTHEDRDIYEAMGPRTTRKTLSSAEQKQLEKEARRVVALAGSEITAGAPGEPILGRWTHNDVEVTRRPADPLGILRISVGGGVNDKDGNPVDYLVFRGDPQECVRLLRNALVALDWATGASATQSP